MFEQPNRPIDNLITDHMDIWSSAIKRKSSSGRGSSKKIELYGIKKLRALILELAVRGKLVAQDAIDEPASVLLERIAAEKAELVKQGKIKKPKKLPEISEDEKPFELPEGWEWAQINELSKQVTDGVHHTPKYLENGVPFISVKDINGKTIEFDDCKYISEEQHLDINKRCNPEKGDILLCRIGTLGRATIVDTELPFSLFVSVGLLKFFQNELLPQYTHLALHSPCLLNQYEQIKAGGSHTNKLNLTDIPKLLIPIPSLSEQHCIVAKVDELMALCDQLEAQTETSLDTHQTLVTVLLDTLVNSPNAEELTENWMRISGHFDTLFTTEQSIDQLKQTILQLAVMGKLVPQDPNDEPASELLKRIAAEKEELVKQKKIKKQKPLPPISDDEKPFELPKGWECERVGTFCLVGTGATPSRSNSAYWSSAQYNWVSSGETSKLYISDTNEKISELAVKETNVTVYPTGTLIVAMYGQGKTRGQVSELLHPAGTNQACAAIQLVEKDIFHKDYVKLFFLKSYNELREFAAGGAQPNLNVAKVANTIVPIPPLSEQHRIVAKVDQIMAICDQLKAQLSEAQTTQLNLADALVAQAVD
jgi:type I restriction enzyme S subunit